MKTAENKEVEQILIDLLNKEYKKELIWCSVISAVIGALIAVVCSALIASLLPARSIFTVSVSNGSGSAIISNSKYINNEITYEVPSDLLDYLAEQISKNIKTE